MNIRTENLLFWLFVCIGLSLMVVSFWSYFVERQQPNYELHAVYKSGTIGYAPYLIAAPISGPEDVNKIWPAYIVSTEVETPVGVIKCTSEPFIVSDNPAVQGRIAGRTVYYAPNTK